jgi:hypothetical protein
MPATSTLTAPIAGRIRIDDADKLRRVAEREGVTVSALLKRLMSEVTPGLA